MKGNMITIKNEKGLEKALKKRNLIAKARLTITQ